MWKLGRTESFVHAAKRYLRRRRDLQPLVTQVLSKLEQDPFDPYLHTHALKGQLLGLYAVRVTYQVRLLVQIDSEKREVVLVDLGDHDGVYR